MDFLDIYIIALNCVTFIAFSRLLERFVIKLISEVVLSSRMGVVCLHIDRA